VSSETRPSSTACPADPASVPAPLLPLGALLLAASCNGLAQTAPPASNDANRALREMVVREMPDAATGKQTLRATTTSIGKG